ncbi:MAG: hypothetical protein QOE52_303 [Mycobacterium sp.]|jgi:hypothetical protein|nr:hypothetical protein [Mycobacterium sp.]MDT5341119.1 hypothetical protein [Mycobacterium sp.]MDT5353082.1 hypothetical protein [Mycobacterium sp.]MDT5371149.1 hypothetical protein [Mycobacterium sp.]MDT7720845.1 hypothetical protein [Mycobacterium sp.]
MGTAPTRCRAGEHPSLPSFRRDVLKQLHKDRLIEYDLDKRTVRMLPPGVTAAEELLDAR